MKRLVIILLLLTAVAIQSLYARHIKGGEISYIFVGPGAAPGTERYQITLRLFLECNASGQQFQVKIAEVKDDVVILDANHPLAGEELIFDLELVEIVGAKPQIIMP